MAKPVGRPTVYDSKYCQMLIEHMSEGLSFESFGAVVGHHKQTLYEWAAKHKDFGDAKQRGTDLSRLRWEKEGIKGMWGGKQFNSAIWIYNMRCRFPKQWNPDAQDDPQKRKKGFGFFKKSDSESSD